MISAVHIEDEIRNIELLETLLRSGCADIVKLVGYAREIESAYQLINTVQPQLVYLDIELNKGNAFELLSMFDKINFEVIFISAYSEYGLKAIRANALDYILKPISTDELRAATEKAVNKINQATAHFNLNLVEALNKMREETVLKKIGIPVLTGLIFVNSDDIVSVEASGSYTIIYFINAEKIICTKNLKYLESILPSQSFLRVHHSWIVHLKYIKKYYRGKAGLLEMENGTTICVSVRKRKSLFDQLFG
ncbi:MAG: response regulator transcription factor [Bacteroidetes bacterium]|nr:response regulator transcription factor [Bacteroidota bacterium]